MGQQFRLAYTVNAEAKASDLRIPELADFDVLMGPSTSSSMSTQIINGSVSSETAFTFTYILMPKKEGTFNIGAASIKVKGANYTSNAVSVKVLPPDKASEASGGIIPDSLLPLEKMTILSEWKFLTAMCTSRKVSW